MAYADGNDGQNIADRGASMSDVFQLIKVNTLPGAGVTFVVANSCRLHWIQSLTRLHFLYEMVTEFSSIIFISK